MKIFQVVNNFCFKDYTPMYKSVEEAKKHYAPDIEFIEAPDYVFENWGYNRRAKTEEKRFIKPTPPEGWEYDENTGTFYIPLTPSQKREQAYGTEAIIEYNGQLITVNEAERQAQYYLFEDTETAKAIVAELTVKITEAKSKIREEYPEENKEDN